MTVFWLKLIAIISMTIDHTGAVFSDYTPFVLRNIGRMAFPIYAFLIAQGARYTKNIEKFMLRLFLFALISQVPYNLALNRSTFGNSLFDRSTYDFLNNTNIFYTLFLAVSAIFAYSKLKHTESTALKLMSLLLGMAYMYFVNVTNIQDTRIIYAAAYMIFCAVSVTAFMSKPKFMNKSGVESDNPLTGEGALDSPENPEFPDKLNGGFIDTINKITSSLLEDSAILLAIPSIILADILGVDFGMFAVVWIFAMYLCKKSPYMNIAMLVGILYRFVNLPFTTSRILSLIFALISFSVVLLYNGKQGPKLKWLFYVYYPLHLVVLVIIFRIYF